MVQTTNLSLGQDVVYDGEEGGHGYREPEEGCGQGDLVHHLREHLQGDHQQHGREAPGYTLKKSCCYVKKRLL